MSSPLVEQVRAALKAARKNRDTDRPLRFSTPVSHIDDRPRRWHRQRRVSVAREDLPTLA